MLAFALLLIVSGVLILLFLPFWVLLAVAGLMVISKIWVACAWIAGIALFCWWVYSTVPQEVKEPVDNKVS